MYWLAWPLVRSSAWHLPLPKGSRMRRNVLHQGENYLDDIKDKFEDFLDNATKKIESSWRNAEGLASQGKTKLRRCCQLQSVICVILLV